MLEDTSNNLDISDIDFEKIAKLAKNEFGLNLLKGKKALIASRLSKRLNAKNISSISEYLESISTDNDPNERDHLITALTTNVTSFFREVHHFEYLEQNLSEMVGKKKRIRLWSAGCSSGQEPYSMAMTVLCSIKNQTDCDIKILATDIDQSILDTAKKGIYSNDTLESIPENKTKFVQNVRDQDGTFSICNDAKDLVTFGQLNLIENWPIHGPFDAIFCRNVTIYFDAETQKKLWTRFCEMLSPGGLLCIGHSERLSGPATAGLDNIGVTSYRKIPGKP